MDFISVCEASVKWGVSVRRVQCLCRGGLIPGAVQIGKVYAIPRNTAKPDDRRRKTNRLRHSRPHQTSSVIQNSEGLFEKIVEGLPCPVQVFSPDGTAIVSNDAFLDTFQIQDRDLVVHKYNVLKDPDMEKWGIKEQLLKAFQGETVRLRDVKVPVRYLAGKVCDSNLRFETIFQDITIFPIFNEDHLVNVVAVFETSRLYGSREEVAKSKQYMEVHLLEDFDLDKIAGAVNLSKYYFAHLFKEYTGITPYGYYQDIKIDMLKERLRNGNSTVSQAFADCGVDYNGNFAKIFKKKVGLTPSQYQASVLKE